MNTTIVKNKIYNGRIEGIFALDCGKAQISRNKIYGNNHGIVLITSSPFIMRNQVYKNKFYGVIMIKDSQPFIQNNLLKENREIGLYIKDKSHGLIEMNRVSSYIVLILLITLCSSRTMALSSSSSTEIKAWSKLAATTCSPIATSGSQKTSAVRSSDRSHILV